MRDHKGNALACLSTIRKLNSQPILAECLALWRALEFEEDLGLRCVQFEGDAQTIINAVTTIEDYDAWFGGIVEDVKIVLLQHSCWNISFVHRD